MSNAKVSPVAKGAFVGKIESYKPRPKKSKAKKSKAKKSKKSIYKIGSKRHSIKKKSNRSKKKSYKKKSYKKPRKTVGRTSRKTPRKSSRGLLRSGKHSMGRQILKNLAIAKMQARNEGNPFFVNKKYLVEGFGHENMESFKKRSPKKKN